jgi:hypothetical protein
VQFFGAFGGAWDDDIVARWSANPLAMLWPEHLLRRAAETVAACWPVIVIATGSIDRIAEEGGFHPRQAPALPFHGTSDPRLGEADRLEEARAWRQPVTRWMAANVAVALDPAGNLEPPRTRALSGSTASSPPSWPQVPCAGSVSQA